MATVDPRLSWMDRHGAYTAMSSATLHEAAQRTGALPAQIKPVAEQFRVHGPAFPIRCPPGDNLWLHRAVYAAPSGAVLVADIGDGYEYGYWGEILSVAAQQRGLQGLVINGGVRDHDALLAAGFPVFSRGLCIRGTAKDPAGSGALGEPIRLGEVEVRSNDLVVGDRDGVVTIPANDVGTVLAASRQREADEAGIMERLRNGERTLDIYQLP